MCEWWSALLLSEYVWCLISNFIYRFGKEVCRTRKWTRAVWLDGWSCKQSTCQVEDHQHPAGTDPHWSTAYHSYNLQWPGSEFHSCVYHLEKSNYQAIHMVYCYRSVKGSIRWWSETSTRTDYQVADINSSNYKHFFINWIGTFMHSLASNIYCNVTGSQSFIYPLHTQQPFRYYCSKSLILYNTLKIELCSYSILSHCRNHSLSCTQLYEVSTVWYNLISYSWS